MKLGLKLKILLFILLPLTLFLVILYLLLFNPIKSFTEDTTKQLSIKTSHYYSLLLNNVIKSDIDALKIMKASFENYNGGNSNKYIFQKDLLKHQILNKKEILSAWFLKKNNNKNHIIQYFQKGNEVKFLSSNIKNDDFYSELYRNVKESAVNLNIYTKKIKKTRANNDLIFSIVSPIIFSDQTFGLIGFDFSIKVLFKEIEDKNKFSKTDLILLYNNDFFNLGYSISEDDIKKTEFKDFILSSNKEINKPFLYNSDINNKSYSVTIKPTNLKTTTGNAFLIVIEETNITKSILSTINETFFIFLTVLLVVVFLTTLFILNIYKKQINETASVLDAMAFGNISEIKSLKDTKFNDISKINKFINVINLNLDKTADFINVITKRNFNYDYKVLNENDKIGNSLISLKKNLEQSQEIELKRKEEDEKQTWATAGTAKFSEIIREHSDNLEDLSYAIISDLVKYIGANQGGVFVINEDANNEKYIELLASYAFSRRKMLTKIIPCGVGLVGRCILEKETIFMTKIPEKYLTISSGLGEETPASLLIVPLIFHEEVYGVVELASFTEIEQYKINLVEHISESIASAISMVKINVRTAELLKETKIKSEQTASQEKEIRQNIEEMQAATDELNAKLEDANSVFYALSTIANIAQFDMNGRIIDASENFLKLLQKERKDIIGKVQGSFSEEAKNPISFENFWNKLRKGEQMEFEQVIKVNDEVIRLNSIYIPIKNSNGEVYKVVSFANKI